MNTVVLIRRHMETQITTSKSNYGRLLTFTFTFSFNPVSVSLGGVSKCLDWIVRVAPVAIVNTFDHLGLKEPLQVLSNDPMMVVESHHLLGPHGVAAVSVPDVAQRQDFGKPRAAMPVKVHSPRSWKQGGAVMYL